MGMPPAIKIGQGEDPVMDGGYMSRRPARGGAVAREVHAVAVVDGRAASTARPKVWDAPKASNTQVELGR